MDKGGVNSGPDSYGVPDGERTDGPGFSLCAAPLESSGPGFQDGRVNGMKGQISGVSRLEMAEEVTVREGVEAVWIYFEESTSSMRATVLLQTVCNALVRGQRLFLTMSQIC